MRLLQFIPGLLRKPLHPRPVSSGAIPSEIIARIGEKANGRPEVIKLLTTCYRRLDTHNFEILMLYAGNGEQLWHHFRCRQREVAPQSFGAVEFALEYIGSAASLHAPP